MKLYPGNKAADQAEGTSIYPRAQVRADGPDLGLNGAVVHWQSVWVGVPGEAGQDH